MDKNVVNGLDYEGIQFRVLKKDYCRIKQKNNICINLFSYKIKLAYPVHISDQKCGNCIDLLTMADKSKSNYVYIKSFNKFMCNITNNKSKNRF